MPIWPRVDLVIPCHPSDQHHLSRLLDSIARQAYPKDRVTLHVITEGDSEEAKAIGIHRCTGDLIGMFCADNVLDDPAFLRTMAEAASRPTVIGAFPASYTYCRSDSSLTRYFALLGANDPLCWWLGKADRRSAFQGRDDGIGTTVVFERTLPSIGDNGCFFKRQALQLVTKEPARFGSCMCVCEDLRRLGFSTYAVTTNSISHRTGDAFWTYVKKRWRYVNALYWDRHAIRRWLLVHTVRDWAVAVGFAVASLLVLPQLFVSLRGFRRLHDPAWAWHPLVCFTLTLLYTWAFLMSRWRFARSSVKRNWRCVETP